MAKKKEATETVVEKTTETKVPNDSIKTVKRPVKWFIQEAIDKRKEKK